jgi:hypothetical protein
VPYLFIPGYIACAWAWFLRVGKTVYALQDARSLTDMNNFYSVRPNFVTNSYPSDICATYAIANATD